MNPVAQACSWGATADQTRDVTPETILLVLVVVTALGFDFTNGFHDTGNAMATSIATGALKPRVAVSVSAILNLVGAFLSVEVALTVTNAVVKIQDDTGAPKGTLLDNDGYELLMIVLAGLVGGIVWNLLTWLLGLPSSSSHALFGGLIGSTIAGLGLSGVNWTGDGSKLDGVVGKVILPALMSPVLAALVAGVGTWLIYRIAGAVAERFKETGFRWGQIVSRLTGVAGPRHQRRPEDHGCDHSRADRGRRLDGHGVDPVLGEASWPWRSHWAPISAAGASSARWARGWWRSARPRAWRPRARPRR